MFCFAAILPQVGADIQPEPALLLAEFEPIMPHAKRPISSLGMEGGITTRTDCVMPADLLMLRL